MRLSRLSKPTSKYKVVVFDSAVEGFFLTHYDFLAKLEDSTNLPPGPTGLQPLPDMLVRVSRAPVVSIAATGDERRGSEASLLSRAICGLRAAKKRSCRNGRLGPVWFQAADRWHDSRVLSAGDERSKCCLGQTILAANSRSVTATLIALCPTRSSTRLSTGSPCGFPHSINRPSRKRSAWLILLVCRRTRKLRLSGMRFSLLSGDPPARPGYRH